MNAIQKTNNRMSVKNLLQRLMFLMVAMMASMALVACLEDEGNDPDDPDNGGGGGTVSGKRIKTMVISAEKPVDGPVRNEYIYNSDGTLKQVDAYDNTSKLVLQSVFTSNSDGTHKKQVGTYFAYLPGTVVELNYTYDGNKKPLKTEGTTTINGVVGGTLTIDYTFQNGRKISQIQKTMVTGMGVVQQMEYEFSYDANGRRTKTVMTSMGITVEYTRTYNSDGTLQKVTYNDGDGVKKTHTFTWENGKMAFNWDDYADV
jgi:hypothetical protein